jgi:uncharacterized phage protein (TIGR01671 family)
MSREIKYRVFDKEKNEMYYLLKDRWSFGPCEGIRAVSWEDVFAAQEPGLIPLEYTGLKDKNGVEIYEGDIVRYITHSKEYLLVVKWNTLDACFDFGWVRTNYAINGEVIGNIYQNPELLERGE